MKKWVTIVLVKLFFIIGIGNAWADVDLSVCASLDPDVVRYGPWDYTNPEHFRDKLPIVERAHFTPEVERLESGHTSYDPMDDIRYTLDKFPNHHRALYAMARYRLQQENPPMAGSPESAECWFERARAFQPEDGVVPMIYGIYLHQKGDLKGALSRYEQSLSLMPDSPELHYNMGLLYMDFKEYEKARQHARKAYQGNYPLPGLREQLKAVGMWESAD